MFHKLRTKYVFCSNNIHCVLKLSLYFVLQTIVKLQKFFREIQFTYIAILFACYFHSTNVTN